MFTDSGLILYQNLKTKSHTYLLSLSVRLSQCQQRYQYPGIHPKLTFVNCFRQLYSVKYSVEIKYISNHRSKSKFNLNSASKSRYYKERQVDRKKHKVTEYYLQKRISYLFHGHTIFAHWAIYFVMFRQLASISTRHAKRSGIQWQVSLITFSDKSIGKTLFETLKTRF